jgi:hypothetical protein
MLRGFIVAAASTAVLLAATSASAQEAKGLGQQGQFIISADRLAPLFTYSNNKTTDTTTNPNTSTSTTTTAIGIFPSLNDIGFNGNFYNIPRVGFDYVVIPHLTVGGDIAFATQLGSSTTESQGSGSVSNDGAKATYFSIAPRVGYILPLTDMIAFWPRGGLGFHLIHSSSPDRGNANQTITNSSNLTLWAIDLEPLFVLSPVEHFGFFAGPVIDIPLTGSSKTDTTTTPPGTTVTRTLDYSSFHFGITAGLLGWF